MRAALTDVLNGGTYRAAAPSVAGRRARNPGRCAVAAFVISAGPGD